MARYPRLLGRKVEVHYRAGDVVMPASGVLVADSGRSIFLEQSLLQRDQSRHFRWEIPYQYVVRIEENLEKENSGAVNNVAIAPSCSESARAAAAIMPSLIPLSDKPKTA